MGVHSRRAGNRLSAGGTVLVVDDEAPIRRVFTTALERAGFTARAVESGHDALAVAADETVAAVLLDSSMPGMSGVETLRALRQQPGGATLPIILVTGADSVADKVAGLEAGANDYIVKPVALDELVARVRAQLHTHQRWATTVDDLERRLDAVMLLRRIRRAEAAEITAREVCRELGTINGIEGSAVLVLRGARSVVPLAVQGVLEGTMTAGEPLDELASPVLVDRLRQGPWLDHPVRSRRMPAARSLTDAHPVAVAPLAGLRGPVGALVLAAPGEAVTRPRMLSAAIDFAAVVSALISPELERQEALDEARDSLRGAVARGEFTPHFQVIRELATDRAVGFEGLTRWRDGARPDLRLAEAAALGIGLEVEQATLAALLADAETLDEAAWLSVNVSPALLASGIANEMLSNAARPLVIELTEHEPVDDYDALLAQIEELRGVQVAIDDAGAGYSSMRHVLDLRPDLVKLDLSWVRGVDVDPARQALISGMTGFASELGCALIAEGIETPEEKATLQRLGIRLGQGYLLGRPAPARAWR